MNDLIESLIHQFKKQKIIRGNIYDNFMFYSYKTLGADKDDKYKVKVNEILQYIIINKESIKLKLIQN